MPLPAASYTPQNGDMTRLPRASTLRRAYICVAAADAALAGVPRSTTLRRLRRLTKPALMPLLAASLAVHESGKPTGVVRRAVLAGEALSWAGDVALLGKSRGAFLSGVGCFLGAHLRYGVSFWELGSRPSTRPIGATSKAVIGLACMMTPAMAWAAGRKDPALRIPVAVYAAALAGMVALANDLDPGIALASRRDIARGARLFLASDLTLGLAEFVLDDAPGLDAVVMATYTAAQLLIADGVRQLATDATVPA